MPPLLFFALPLALPLALALAAVAADDGGLPDCPLRAVQWAQDNTRLHLQLLDVTCKGAPTLSSGVDSLSFRCTSPRDGGGCAVRLEFLFRDRIQPGLTRCQAKRHSHWCTLTKEAPHTFDRVLFDKEDPLQRHLTVNWAKFAPEEDDFSQPVRV